MIGLPLLFILAQAPVSPRVSLSGYVQPQYEVRTSGGETTDRVLFRRMFFTLDATVAANWTGQFQVDAGRLASFGERPIIKNAFIQYTGWKDHGYVVTIGNQKPPMSRSLLASSSRRGLIERPFTGDRAYGSPGRAPLIKIDGSHHEQHVSWSAAIGTSRQVPDADEVRIDGPSESGSAGNEGPLAAARLDIHPLGEPSREHGDFGGPGPRFTIGVAAYGWWNDNDVGPHGGDAVDASRVTAYEVSGALRGGGVSLDAQYNRVDARAVDEDVLAGLYLDGRALLHQASIEGGYMLWQRRLEAVAMFDAMDTESFSQTWRRAAAGMNWYVKRHDLKFSLMHRESFDERGVAGARSHTTYVQTQFAF